MRKLNYQQPNMEKIGKEYRLLLDQMKEASLPEQLLLIEKINRLREDYFSMYWTSYCSYLLDVTDPYFKEQEDFFANTSPIMDQYKLAYFESLLASSWQDELRRAIGDKVFAIAALELKLKNMDGIKEEREISLLSHHYVKTMASITVSFEGEELSINQLAPYLKSSNREVRKKAYQKRYEAISLHQEELNTIFDSLIEKRTEYAKKGGFSSYTEVSYLKMNRIGYGKKEVSIFRDAVVETIVPFLKTLFEERETSLNLGPLYYYDQSILFPSGPAALNKNCSVAKTMPTCLQSLSKELSNFYDKLYQEGWLSLESKKGKSGGGITTYLPKEQMPIFLLSLNGTSYDVKVLSHEFGHAFQLYSSRNLKYYENWWPTFDTCEIASTSLELLTLPYADLFFGPDADKYRYETLLSRLEEICESCLGDEFQEKVYDGKLDARKRNDLWRELKHKYQPWINYEENTYLKEGNGWQTYGHFFSSPFYYIDYGLASIAAFQLYLESLTAPQVALDKYFQLCRLGGSLSFLEMYQALNLNSPFELETLPKIMKQLIPAFSKIK